MYEKDGEVVLEGGQRNLGSEPNGSKFEAGSVRRLIWLVVTDCIGREEEEEDEGEVLDGKCQADEMGRNMLKILSLRPRPRLGREYFNYVY